MAEGAGDITTNEDNERRRRLLHCFSCETWSLDQLRIPPVAWCGEALSVL